MVGIGSGVLSAKLEAAARKSGAIINVQPMVQAIEPM